MPEISIHDRQIGPAHPPYVIAETSGSHNQSLERAPEIVDAATAHGADAIKLQTFTADAMTLNVHLPGFLIDDPKSLWAGRQLHEQYQEAHTHWEWHWPIMERAEAHGVHSFSTAFDDSAVDFLESLIVPAYKIASFENTDLPLIKRVAASGKPMIISMGMATSREIEEAVHTASDASCRDLILLKCISSYPAPAENTNVSTVPHMHSLFGCEVGLSDHTMGCGVAVAATALGATVIEKHFKLRHVNGGVDSAFAMEPKELKQLRDETERTVQALGSVSYGPTASEMKSLVLRRSLSVTRDVQVGEVLTPENVGCARPEHELAPKCIDQVFGLRASRVAPAGTPVTWQLLG